VMYHRRTAFCSIDLHNLYQFVITFMQNKHTL